MNSEEPAQFGMNFAWQDALAACGMIGTFPKAEMFEHEQSTLPFWRTSISYHAWIVRGLR
jgi:hypothetical protein